MANALNTIVTEIAASDPQLARRLEAELASRQVRTGLVWEHHAPESAALTGLEVRAGSRVRLLAPRGVNAEKLSSSRKKADRAQVHPLWSTEWNVRLIQEGTAALEPVESSPDLAELELAGHPVPRDGDGSLSWPVNDLVAVARFDTPVYPGLVKTGQVRRGGDDDPEHVVINAENFHALQALRYTHAGKIDAIYIDPPYNTGARDWKYNNDYVDRDDTDRHSKWLSFMEHRLKVAKELLNPADSVLIVTIDEKEYLRLGLLLEQTFREARIQMVSININANGVARDREMSRVDEYAFFVYLGSAGPVHLPDASAVEQAVPTEGSGRTTRWEWLLRGGAGARRSHSPGCFYPVYVDPKAKRIVHIGDALPAGVDRGPEMEGLVQVLPLAESNGEQKRWRMTPNKLRELVGQGLAKVGAYDSKRDRYSLLYLGRGQRNRIESGDLIVVGVDENGVKEVREAGGRVVRRPPKTVWTSQSHSAGEYGSRMITALHGDKRFTYPKSLYAVEDCLRAVVKDKPEATILDFFSGSGTTAHAVMRLNKQDGGRRRSISVTNNEVSAEEQEKLIAQGLRPGDAEWDQWGIADHVTKPRLQAAITGRTATSGFTTPIKGEYKFTDPFPMAEGLAANASFYTLTYEDPDVIEVGLAFERIAPLLWLAAGQTGPAIESVDPAGYAIADRYAVLFDTDRTAALARELARAEHAGLVSIYVVTDHDIAWQRSVDALRHHVPMEAIHRLYESYLRNFGI